MNDVKVWYENLERDVFTLLSCDCLKENAFRQIDVNDAKVVLSKTQKIHQDGEQMCVALESARCANHYAIKFDVAKIMATVFLDVDEFLYAKFPELVKVDLKDDDGSYVSSFCSAASVNLEAWKQKLLDTLRDLKCRLLDQPFL